MPTTTNIDINVIQNLQQAASTSLWAAVISGAAAIVAAIIAIVGLVIQAKLNNKLKEHEIRFSKLHEKRAEVIAKLYAKVFNIEDSVKRYSAGIILSKNEEEIGNIKEERKKEAYQSLISFREFYQKNAIWFSDEILAIVEQLDSIASDAALAKTFPDDNSRMKQKQLLSDFPKIKNTLKQEFKKLLGSDIN